MQKVLDATWKKDSVLSDLKTQHAAIDRKIQLSITSVSQQGPIDPENKPETIQLPADQQEKRPLSRKVR